MIAERPPRENRPGLPRPQFDIAELVEQAASKNGTMKHDKPETKHYSMTRRENFLAPLWAAEYQAAGHKDGRGGKKSSAQLPDLLCRPASKAGDPSRIRP